jgi:hypothetical protein
MEKLRPMTKCAMRLAAIATLAAIPRMAHAQSTSMLLFPYASNQAGFDTGIVIANTTADPFGTAQASGTCMMTFYGSGAPAQPVTTAAIAPGQTDTNLVSTLAPGFQGYLIVQCKFPLARGWGFFSNAAAKEAASIQAEVITSLPR